MYTRRKARSRENAAGAASIPPERLESGLVWGFCGCGGICELLQGITLRRLFSTFARGGPGVGLLLLRLAAAMTAGVRGYEGIDSASATGQIVLNIAAIAVGILLALGLWTPVAGSLMALFGALYAVSLPEHLWSGVLLAAVGAGLALIGPGAWSIDARLFGWKRIDVRDRTGS